MGSRAFTLIDLVALLACVAVLAGVFISLQLGCRDTSMESPSAPGPTTQPAALGLDGPLQLARRAQCSVNMKAVGASMHLFAAAHGDRFPAFAVPVGEKEIQTWQDMLNQEVLRGEAGKGGDGAENRPQQILRWWDQKTPPEQMRRTLTCTSLRAYGDPNRHPRPYAMNLDAAGGPRDGNARDPVNMLALGPNVMFMIPPPLRYDAYVLGSRSSHFSSPTYQFLVCESEATTDEIYCVEDKKHDPNGRVTLGDSTAYPPWSGCQGSFAFRHNPTRSSAAPDVPSANFLFIDGHVEPLTPDDRINKADRFAAKH
jgi:prepilin-type processing-associated H-X9-DG protein